MINFILSFIIRLFHIITILFVLFAPFIFGCSPLILLLHIIFCISLIIHWVTNQDVCCLSELEAYVMGKDRVETFSHKLISPIYNLPEKSWSTLCYIVVIILLFVSIYKLVNCKKVAKIKELLEEGKLFSLESQRLFL